MEKNFNFNQMKYSNKIIARFLSKINISDNYQIECWEWLEYKDKDGYGQFSINGKKFRINRFSFELFFGSIQTNLIIRHNCDNPSCVNPYHLELGTNQNNMDDMVERNRSLKGSKHFNHILMENQVIDILDGIENKKYETIKQIKNTFSISSYIIYKILDGYTWIHITKDYDLNKLKKLLINGHSKLLKQDIDNIRNLLGTMTLEKIAKIYNVNLVTIFNIKNNKFYQNI